MTPGTTSGPADRATGKAPVVTDVSPASGPTAGGTNVTVTGSGFTGATAVSFGPVAVLDPRVASDTQLTITSPPAAATGPVDLTVTTPAGTSAAAAADRFTYLATGLAFLSWYRTGLSAAVQPPATGAPLDTPPPAAVTAQVTAHIGDPDNPGDTTTGNTATGSIQVRLHAPGDVTGLDTAQIIRTYPAPGAANVTPGRFPLIEFARPDVPWIMSPTGPQQPTSADPRWGLTPWMCLIVVAEPPGTLSPPATPGALPTLTVIDSELPAAAATWPWAHAQATILSTDDHDQALPELISQQPERALSRLLSPRYLHENTSYLACVVPTFAPSNGAATLSPAWQHSIPPAPVTLPVYYYWRFTTGLDEPDFSALVQQLKRWDQGGVGIRPLDVGDAGAGMPSPAAGQAPWLMNLEGALVSADVTIGSWRTLSDPTAESQIQQALADRLSGTPGELSPPTYGSTQASFRGQLLTASAPVVAGVSPASGSADGGNRVTVTGSGFTGATAVSFGPVAATGLSVANDTQLTVTSPPAAASGPVDLTVTTPAGTSAPSSAGQFTYRAAGQPPVVTGVGPASGWVSGNDPVTVTGSGFTGATAVSFGPVAATGPSVANDTQLTVTSPPAAASGPVDLTVTTPAGTSAPSSAGQFTYRAAGQPPVVTGVGPASGWVSGNDPVTVTGSGFTGATAVSFGPVAATGLSVANDTQLTVTSPPAAASGPVDLTVTTPAGTSAPSSAGQFTYRAAGTAPVWLRTLNLDPRYRAAAAVGAGLVRANQEALILSAWDQAGQARTANQVLRQGQLARELGQSTYTRRIGGPGSAAPPMEDDRLLQLTCGVQAQIPAPSQPETQGSGQQSVADAVAANPAVAAVLSVPFRRTASPGGPLASRLITGLLPPPVANVGKGGIIPTPPLASVTGMVDLARLSQDPTNPEILRAFDPGRVSTPRLPWEHGSAIQKATDAAGQGDLLLQPGYLSDLWVVGSSLGQALDWDGTALLGWTDPPVIYGFTPGPAAVPGGILSPYYSPLGYAAGGVGCLVSWNQPGVSPEPAVATVNASIELDKTGPDSYNYQFKLSCVLRGDVISGGKGTPVQMVPNENDVLYWPTIPLLSASRQAVGETGFLPAYVAPGIGTGDLTGSGKPSIAVAWTGVAGLEIKVLIDVDVYGNTAQTIYSSGYGAPFGDVQGVALANSRLFILIGGDLWSASVNIDAGTLGRFTVYTNWAQYQPANWAWATITAADFSGSGKADLLFFYAVPVPGAEGAAAYRATYRIGYEPDIAGEPAYWGEEVGAPIPVTGVPTSLVLGPINTIAVRDTTSQVFRAAAAATQTRLTNGKVIPSVASPPPPQPVPAAGLAGAVRAAIDPRRTVPASVTPRLVLPAALDDTAGGDVLQPLGFTPSFPQPFYETVRDGALPWLIPGMSSFPDEAITVLGADPAAIEAILLGANNELARELLWRGVPAPHTATYFARFWDGRDSAGTSTPDITGISAWPADSDLGSHSPAAGGDLAVLLWRGALVRLFPHVTIYAAPAIRAGADSRTVDLTQRIDPVFSGTLGGDMAFAGFPFTVQAAMSGSGSRGKYFVFQEHPTAPRFGLTIVQNPASFGVTPAAWSDLDWSATVRDQASYQALTYLDTSQTSSRLWGVSLPDSGETGAPRHRWGVSAAHMAHITYQPPALIAIHADELLKAASTLGVR